MSTLSTVESHHQCKSLLEILPKALLNRFTTGFLSWFLVFLSGAMVPLSFAPFNTSQAIFSYLLFFPLAVFFLQLLHTRHAKEAFYKGLLFGVGLFSVGVSWIYVAIHDFGAAHWSLAGLFTLLFVLFLAVFYGLMGWGVFKLRKMTKKSGQQTVFSENVVILFFMPVLWVFLEWLRSWFLTGFPWLLMGYPMIETPLAAYAPLVGIYGLSLLVILISALLVARIKAVYSVLSMSALFVIAGLLGQIQWSEPQGGSLSVALIQGNVEQSVKWDRKQLEKTKQLYVSLSKDRWQNNDLIIWPENAIPFFYHQLESSFYRHLSLQARQTQTELITGLPFFDDTTQQYYNAMTNLGGQQGFYYKTHLVPFGEYVPLASLIRGIIQFFNMPMSGFSAGSAEQPPLLIKGNKVVVTLCYEDVFAQDVIPQIPQSQFMINLSNNGWYGDSFAPHQHLEMARMRALETSRDIIRSTTSGISAVINFKGDVLVKGPQFKTAVVNGEVQPRTGTTPYVLWGNKPLWAVFVLAGFLIVRKKA